MPILNFDPEDKGEFLKAARVFVVKEKLPTKVLAKLSNIIIQDNDINIIVPATDHNLVVLSTHLQSRMFDSMSIERRSGRFLLGARECENSPWGNCIYDNINDPCWDFCLICGKSEERR